MTESSKTANKNVTTKHHTQRRMLKKLNKFKVIKIKLNPIG